MSYETDFQNLFSNAGEGTIDIHPLTEQMFKQEGALAPEIRQWAERVGFTGKPGTHCLVPDDKNSIGQVLFGTGEEMSGLDWGTLAGKLPTGSYQIAGPQDASLVPLGWALGGYDFTRYRKGRANNPQLAHALDNEDRRTIEAAYLVRDLINTPANDMGPDELELAVRNLAKRHGASVMVVTGDDLLTERFPMVHAVGRAADIAPRVIEIEWGREDHPGIALVGKGVTFDTGGLNIKPGASMALMKKDMGGAANVLGLAHMIMDAKLPVRLHVVVGAVENAISGNAFRPGDILASRKGISVEIGNTDAEGRLVLGDCLTLADERSPEVMIDMATLTGAARVALGPDLSPFYTGDQAFSSALMDAADQVRDPLWPMPLWKPYQKMLASKVADVNHISGGAFAGSITAALFLSRFVEQAKTWTHFDIYGWVPTAKPWAPVGGEAMGIRALYSVLSKRYPHG